MAGNVAQKTDDVSQPAGDMAAGKPAEKTGEPSLTNREMIGNELEKTGEDYRSVVEETRKTGVESGKSLLAAGEMINTSGEKDDMTTASAFENKENDSVFDADVNSKGQVVEVAAQYKPEGSSSAPVPAEKGPVVTAAGTWLYEDIQFDYNRSDLKPSALASLNELAATLKARPELNIEIQGHTDSSGGRNYNLELSRKRAQSVKAYLESQGIASSRMTVKGFGPDRPMFSDASREELAKNRRVEIKPLN
jgi:outer membrane protein OmpA-like peptidoglycan-associated protein